MLQAPCRAASTRFIAVGLAMTALHLAVFQLLLPWSVPEVANVAAFLLATQVNFLLSYYWTWSDRRPVGRETAGSIARRAALFNGSAAFGFGLNAAGFSTALRVVGLPPVHSAVVATVASAAATFVLSSRVVFVRRPAVPAAVDAPGPVRTPVAAPAADRV
jgi:putative flippase GtrA